MHESVRKALKHAIEKSLSVLQPMTSQYTEPYLIWSKSEDHVWHAQETMQPSWSYITLLSYKSLEQIGTEFLQLLRNHHPEYNNSVGFSTMSQGPILLDSLRILQSAAAELWSRYDTLNCDANAIDTIVQEFADFIDLPSVRIRCTAELLNYDMDPQGINLTDDIAIRHLSEREVTEYYGGSIHQRAIMPRSTIGIDSCVLETEFEEPKLFGIHQPRIPFAQSQTKADFDRTIMALRTFKEGGISLGWVRFKTLKFCPLPFSSKGFAIREPLGSYHISEAETKSLQDHATLIFSTTEPAMEMACSRLSDAQTRLRDQDRLVDAVIGLEALLLAGIETGARRGELRYRFALNYSTLFVKPEERYQSFRIAKDLYDLRSTIAHGGTVTEDNCRVGDEKLTFREAAHRACEVLRSVINHFLPQTAAAPYKNFRYWESSYFGLKS
jgi:hypothetical protein